MLSTDEDALICDLAETYHIYDYRSLPISRVATFACGLRDDSRIKIKMSGINISMDQLLNAAILDDLNLLEWMLGGGKKSSRPSRVVEKLTKAESDNSDVQGFVSPEDFEKAMAAIIEGG